MNEHSAHLDVVDGLFVSSGGCVEKEATGLSRCSNVRSIRKDAAVERFVGLMVKVRVGVCGGGGELLKRDATFVE